MKTVDKYVAEARQEISIAWGNKVIEEIDAIEEKFNGTYNEFLPHCTACGGNWTGMLLSGIQKLFPKVYDAIPNSLGKTSGEAFGNVVDILILVGVNTWDAA